MQYDKNIGITKRKPIKMWVAVGLLALIFTGTYVTYALAIKDYSLHIPKLEKSIAGTAPTIQNPSYGNSGVKLVGLDNTFIKSENSLPTASTIKVLTALLIIEKLGTTDLNNTTFTVNENDIAITNNYIARNGSIVPLNLGQTITYKNALDYIMVRSANNITDIMVNRVFGNTDALLLYAKDYLAKNNLTQTTITDPTGFAPTTVSSPTDLLSIAELAFANTTIASIAKQKEIVLPNGTTAKSTNFFLPSEFGTVIGLKTGFTDEARSVFVGGVQLPNNDIVTTVVMGAENAAQSQNDSLALARQIANTYSEKTIFDANKAISNITLPWGGSAEIYSDKAITIPAYSFEDITYTINPTSIGKVAKNTELVIKSSKETITYPIAIRNAQQPSATWKLLHPF